MLVSVGTLKLTYLGSTLKENTIRFSVIAAISSSSVQTELNVNWSSKVIASLKFPARGGRFLAKKGSVLPSGPILTREKAVEKVK
jgi:hypothetical protein